MEVANSIKNSPVRRAKPRQWNPISIQPTIFELHASRASHVVGDPLAAPSSFTPFFQGPSSIFITPYVLFAISDVSTSNLIPLRMEVNPQCSRFPNNCYTRPNVERWFSEGDGVFTATSQDSVYMVPSILYCHRLNEAQEPSSAWFSSDAAVHAPAIVTQFPDAFLSSDAPTEFAPQWGLVKEKSDPSQRRLFDEHPGVSQVPQRALDNGTPKSYRSKRSSRKRQPVTRDSHRCNVNACNKEFTRKHDLLRHITAVHEKLKPFPCRFEPCESAFPRKDARDVSILHERAKGLQRHEWDIHLKHPTVKIMVD